MITLNVIERLEHLEIWKTLNVFDLFYDNLYLDENQFQK